MTAGASNPVRRAMARALLIVGPLLLFAAGNLAALHIVLGSRFFRGILIAYRFNTWIMPAVLVLAGIFLVRLSRDERRRLLSRVVGVLYIAVGVGGFCVYVYATHIEPYRLVVREVRIANASLTAPLRVLHISDIQSGKVGPYEERAIQRARELNPDLILCTGDLLQPVRPATLQSELPKLAAMLSTLHPPLGMYGVYGTTDWGLRGKSESDLGGMQMLENSGICVTSGAVRVRIYGLSNRDSSMPDAVLPRVAGWTELREENDIIMLMGHMPDFAVAAKDFPIDLCLAGHTHGGQVRLPFVGAVVTLTRHIPRSLALGFRTSGQTRLNVSGGIGSEHAAGLPSMRFGCRPEMTLITFGGP